MHTNKNNIPYSDLNKKTNSMEIGDLMHKYLDYYNMHTVLKILCTLFLHVHCLRNSSKKCLYILSVFV